MVSHVKFKRKPCNSGLRLDLPSSITLEKTFYHSSFGPMLSIPGAFQWGMDLVGTRSAFALYDANLPNFDILDHWLGLNLASDIDEVERLFYNKTGLIFNNAMVR